MEGTRTSLWLFLLLSQLLLHPANTDQYLSTVQTHLYSTEGGSSTPSVQPDLTTADHTDIPNNATGADCLIDTQMGLIAIASAGGLIICLLVTTVVLACQIYYIQRRARAPRPSRSNMDLVSGTGYWGADRSEVGGLVGPCDTSVMLEEVSADREMEERQAASQETGEKAEALLEEGAMTFDPLDKTVQMQSSSSKDSCLDVPRDLEDMPLMV
ncbi:hypothetical protein LDENG_00026030 [Lucifuga dentata]|nr:hypothetical protein LDENG_00026030 [Lucifuga dentata]